MTIYKSLSLTQFHEAMLLCWVVTRLGWDNCFGNCIPRYGGLEQFVGAFMIQKCYVVWKPLIGDLQLSVPTNDENYLKGG
jgi:hypothetical protein